MTFGFTFNQLPLSCRQYDGKIRDIRTKQLFQHPFLQYQRLTSAIMQTFSAISTKFRRYRGHIAIFAANSLDFEIPGKLDFGFAASFSVKPENHRRIVVNGNHFGTSRP